MLSWKCHFETFADVAVPGMGVTDPILAYRWAM